MTAWLVSCEPTTSSAMCAPFTPRMLTVTCASPPTIAYVPSVLRYLLSNIVDSDPKKQSRSKRGVVDVAEPLRPRSVQPYSTSSSHHRRGVSDAVADYDFSQPPQAQPQAFFAHGQGQRYGPYGKVVHRPRVLILYRVARLWYSTGACGLCPRRRLSRILGRWKTRRWEDNLSSLLNISIIIALFRITKTDPSMLTDTSSRKPKIEITCMIHHVSNFFWIFDVRGLPIAC